jgi:FkbM family methyltransferase
LAQLRNSAMDGLLSRVMGQQRVPLERIGSDYGAFWIPSALLAPSSRGLLISAGVGGDVTFDQALQGLGYRVIALDPLPECVEFARQHLDPASTEVLEAGLWSQEGHLTFYAPRVAGHDSWSAINIQETAVADTVDFAVITLRSIFHQYPDALGASPLVLKMNIEGAEDAVLFHLADVPVSFDAILVHLESLSQVRLRSPVRFLRQVASAIKLCRQLRGLGYRVARCQDLQMVLIKPVAR